MGLDMYLSVRKYINRVDFSKGYDDKNGWSNNPDFDRLIESGGFSEWLEPQDSTGANIEIPVAYWRKANAIHKWFVDERADGQDNCQPISAHVDHLKELLELCDQALEDKKNADEYLPTESGFFFGGTEYDEYYFQDLEYTQRRLRELIPMMEKSGNDWAVYQASW